MSSLKYTRKYKNEHGKLKATCNCKILLGGEDVKINIWRKNTKQKKNPTKTSIFSKIHWALFRGQKQGSESSETDLMWPWGMWARVWWKGIMRTCRGLGEEMQGVKGKKKLVGKRHQCYSLALHPLAQLWTQSSGKCHAQAHKTLGRFNLQTGSWCNCPSLIPILVVLGTPESPAHHHAYTSLRFTSCLHGTAKFPCKQKQWDLVPKCHCMWELEQFKKTMRS